MSITVINLTNLSPNRNCQKKLATQVNLQASAQHKKKEKHPPSPVTTDLMFNYDLTTSMHVLSNDVSQHGTACGRCMNLSRPAVTFT